MDKKHDFEELIDFHKNLSKLFPKEDRDFREVMEKLIIENSSEKNSSNAVVRYGIDGNPIFIEYNKFSKVIDSPLNILKQKLSDGKNISNEDQKKLRISIDYTKPSLWDKRRIAWQAAAQILALNRIRFVVKHIKDEILNNKEMYDLLGLSCLTSNNSETRGRPLEDIIRQVNSNPKKNKKEKIDNKRLIKQNGKIPFIPGIYNSKSRKINFQKLSFAILVITKLLTLQNKSYEEIVEHYIIKIYKNLIPSTITEIINHWIRESLMKSGSLFEE